jgi:hypothetical protein
MTEDDIAVAVKFDGFAGAEGRAKVVAVDSGLKKTESGIICFFIKAL